MQTFLPYPDFVDSAACLDRRRLGKQRVEAQQILRTLARGCGSWTNHPAVRMWRGHEDVLRWYFDAVSLEWVFRGYRHTMGFYHLEPNAFGLGTKTLERVRLYQRTVVQPPWLGDERLHASHRAALLAKDPAWYGRFGWAEEPALAYFWPTRNDERYVELGARS